MNWRKEWEEGNEGEIRGDWQWINYNNNDYKNMSKTSIELEWFINDRTHAFIAWFGHNHTCLLVGMHDCHIAFMQVWQLMSFDTCS